MTYTSKISQKILQPTLRVITTYSPFLTLLSKHTLKSNIMEKTKTEFKTFLLNYHVEYLCILMRIKENCILLRKKRNLSKRRIVKILWDSYRFKCHVNTITQIEKGNFYNIELFTLLKISLVLNISIFDIMFMQSREE